MTPRVDHLRVNSIRLDNTSHHNKMTHPFSFAHTLHFASIFDVYGAMGLS